MRYNMIILPNPMLFTDMLDGHKIIKQTICSGKAKSIKLEAKH